MLTAMLHYRDYGNGRYRIAFTTAANWAATIGQALAFSQVASIDDDVANT